LNKSTLISIAGFIWGAVGIMLIYKGTLLFQLAIQEQKITQATLLTLLISGLVIGSAKGYFVLSKTARRNKSRIQDLDIPLKIHHTFPKPFYGLIAGMILLGVLLRCGVGLALIVGSRVYWQSEPEIEAQENPGA
jgi:hypothetical protein